MADSAEQPGFRQVSPTLLAILERVIISKKPAGSLIQNVAALSKHGRLCGPVSVSFISQLPSLNTVQLAAPAAAPLEHTHTGAQRPTQARPHTTPTANAPPATSHASSPLAFYCLRGEYRRGPVEKSPLGSRSLL